MRPSGYATPSRCVTAPDVPVPLAAASLVVARRCVRLGACRPPAAGPTPSPARLAARPRPATSAARPRRPRRARPTRRRRSAAATDPTSRAVSVALEPVVGGLDAPLFVDAGRRRHRPPVRRRAGRRDPDRRGRGAAPEPFLDISDRVTVGRRARAARARLSAGVRRRAATRSSSTTPTATATRSIAAFRATGDDLSTADPGSERTILTQSTSRTPTTTAAGSASTPTGCCSSASATAAAAAIPRTGPATSTSSSASCSGSTSWAPADEPYAIPDGQPVRRRAPTPARRSSTTACATRSATASTRRRATIWIGDVGQNAWEEIDVAPGRRPRPRLRLAALGGHALLRPSRRLRRRPA